MATEQATQPDNTEVTEEEDQGRAPITMIFGAVGAVTMLALILFSPDPLGMTGFEGLGFITAFGFGCLCLFGAGWIWYDLGPNGEDI